RGTTTSIPPPEDGTFYDVRRTATSASLAESPLTPGQKRPTRKISAKDGPDSSRKLPVPALHCTAQVIVAASLVFGKAIETALLNRPLKGVGLLFGVVALHIHGRRLEAATRHTVVTAVPRS